MKSNQKIWIILFIASLVLIQGMNLKLYSDEGFNGHRLNDLKKGIYPEYYGHPPGRFFTDYLNLFFTDLFNESGIGFSLRIVPAIYGIITLYFVYLLSKKI